MSTSGPPEGENPFERLPIFGDLARLFGEQGPVSWEVARQIASLLATEAQPEVNVEPLVRMRFEELARVADLQVAQATGLGTSPSGGVLAVRCVGRAEWARQGLDAYRPLLERLATSLGTPAGDPEAADDQPDPATQLLGNLGQLLGPVMLGMQSGFMLGHLAQRSFGQYDVPIPRPPASELLVVPANIDTFGTEWSLPEDDLRLWVLLREVL